MWREETIEDDGSDFGSGEGRYGVEDSKERNGGIDVAVAEGENEG